MASWLETYPPRRFSDLALEESTIETIERVALQANPPHLLLSGPPDLERLLYGVSSFDRFSALRGAQQLTFCKPRILRSLLVRWPPLSRSCDPVGRIQAIHSQVEHLSMRSTQHFRRYLRTMLLQQAMNLNVGVKPTSIFLASSSLKMLTTSDTNVNHSYAV